MTARSTVDTLRDYLAKGVTGQLRLSAAGAGEWSVYVMQGEILAAHGPQDGAWIIRRLVNNGALSAKQGDRLTAAMSEETPFEELLLGKVPDELFLDLLYARFCQNLHDFIGLEGRPAFQSMDAVFVDNIQVGHDSQALLREIEGLRERTRELRVHAEHLIVRPGPALPTRLEEARLQDLTDPALPLTELLLLSPFESAQTLDHVRSMVSLGGLLAEPIAESIAVPAPMDDEDPVTAELDEDSLEPLGATGDSQLLESDTAVLAADTVQHDLDDELEDTQLPEPAAPEPPDESAQETFDDLAPVGATTGDFPVEDLPSEVPTHGPRDEDEPSGDFPLLDEPSEDLPTMPGPPPEELDELMGGPDEVVLEPEDEPSPALSGDFDSLAGLAAGADASEGEPDTELPRPVAPLDEDTDGEEDEEDEEDQEEDAAEGPDAATDESSEPLEDDISENLTEHVDTGEIEPHEPDLEGTDGSSLGQMEAAIARARRIESRRAKAREQAEASEDGITTRPEAPASPPAPEKKKPKRKRKPKEPVIEDEDLPPTALDVFLDREDARGSGQGLFTLERELLDYVDLSPQGIQETMAQVEDEYGDNEIVELGDAESLSPEELEGLVTLNLDGPRLDENDVRLKVDVASEVLSAVADAYDHYRGRGAGLATVQLLVEGAPSQYAVLFYGVEVARGGRLDADLLLENLRRRPDSEHRRLINRGVLDLIERALSSSVNELPEEAIDPLLQQIAGYQKRLGL